MANKFNILGVFECCDKDQIIVNVRRNYRNYDNEYDVDQIRITLGLSLVDINMQRYTKKDVIAISGRIENSVEQNLVLIAEQIIKLNELHEYSHKINQL